MLLTGHFLPGALEAVPGVGAGIDDVEGAVAGGDHAGGGWGQGRCDTTVSDICGYVTGVAVVGLRPRAVRPVVDLQGAAGAGHLASKTVNIFPHQTCFMLR